MFSNRVSKQDRISYWIALGELFNSHFSSYAAWMGQMVYLDD